MGRPPKKEKKLVQINVMLDQKEIEEIEKLAKKIGITRGQFMRNLVRNGLEEARIFNKSGLLAVVCSGYRAIEAMRDKISLKGLDVLKE